MKRHIERRADESAPASFILLTQAVVRGGGYVNTCCKATTLTFHIQVLSLLLQFHGIGSDETSFVASACHLTHWKLHFKHKTLP